MEKTNELITSLLDRPIWQMTGREFCELAQYALTPVNGAARITPQLVIGVRELALYLGCCEATIYALKRDGILDDAIVSRIGKKIVFDGEKAREAAADYQDKQRALRR